MPSMKKHHDTLVVAMITPARPGPTTVAPFMMIWKFA